MSINIRNAGQYIQTFLRIKTKDNKIVPFKLNSPQRRLYEVIKHEAQANKPIRIIILKARPVSYTHLHY